MDIIPRDEWGAAYGDGVDHAPLPALQLWLHHTVTIAPDLVPPFTDDYEAIRTVDRIGMERFGWAYGFPYTFGITPAGLTFAGHAIDQMGAHTGGRNDISRGIALIGNYEDDPVPDPMLDALVWLVRHGWEQGWWVKPELTGGHRDVKATLCPGANAYRLIDEVNRRAAAEEDIMASTDDLRRIVREEIMYLPIQRHGKGDDAGVTTLHAVLGWSDANLETGRQVTRDEAASILARLDAIEAKLDGEEQDPEA